MDDHALLIQHATLGGLCVFNVSKGNCQDNVYICRMLNEPLSLFQDRRIYSLCELAGNIRETLQVAYPDFYWVKAEIAKLNYYPKSGHCYLDLVEKRDKVTRAEMRATIWVSNYQMIGAKFRQQTREDLHDGMNILFLASVNFHEVYGLSLNIIDIEPSFTLGEMAREKRTAIETLRREGIFDHNRKLTFPPLPKRIAVISVETSKGFHDFVATIRNNPYGYVFRYQLFPSILQGEMAIATIREQLRNIAGYRDHYDVVAIVRGGGGEVGLSAYDHYELARDVAIFPLPVITGIGHSTNETVVEMVAHTNLITPTAVAGFLIQQFYQVEERLDLLESRMMTNARRILDASAMSLAQCTQRFRSLTGRLLERYHNSLGSNQQRLGIFTRHFLSAQLSRLEGYEKRIELLDPQNILKRGYSITYLDNKPLKASSMVKKGQMITTQLCEGSINSIVE